MNPDPFSSTNTDNITPDVREPDPKANKTTPIRLFLQEHGRLLVLPGIVLLLLFGLLLLLQTTHSETDPNTADGHTEEWLEPSATETDSSDSESPDSEPLDTEDPESPPSPPPNGVIRGEVKKGVPVIRSLTDIGLSPGEAQTIINALADLFDFRRAQPGQQFEIRFDTPDRVRSFRYIASRTEIYVVERQEDSIHARKLHIPTQKSNRTFAGTITTSLFGTMQDLGAKPSLAAMVAEILSKQVNFLKEQRPGDTFRVLVEEERLDGDFLRYGPVLALEYNGTRSGQMRLFRFQEGTRPPTYYDTNLVSIPQSALAIPLHYSRLSSPFGNRIHPVLKVRRFHNGVDFSAPVGTPVWACADGTVTFAGYKGPNGNLVSIRHENGVESHYAHLHRIERGIRPGVNVRRRQVVGTVGSTGRSTGPHLHWGVKVNGKFVDPLKFRVVPGKKVAPRHRTELQALIGRLGSILDRTRIEPPKGALAEVPEGDEPLSDI